MTAAADRLLAIDDTLADSSPPTRGDLAAGDRRQLAEQRFVHGLLRALHTADAAAHEARVQRVLEAVAARRPCLLARTAPLAAAVVIAAAAVAWLLRPDGGLPRAQALIAKTLVAMQRPVDRAVQLRIEVETARRTIEREFEVLMRPGRRFRLEGEGRLGRFALGSDGETVWVDPARTAQRHEVAWDDAPRLSDRIGDVLDVGYLDFDTLLLRIPDGLGLHSVRRLDGPAGEAPSVVIEGEGEVPVRHLLLRSVRLLVAEDTGMVRELEAELVPARRPDLAVARVAYRFLAERQVGDDTYRRPW